MKNNVTRLLFLLWLIVVVVAGLAFKKYLELRAMAPLREGEAEAQKQHALR